MKLLKKLSLFIVVTSSFSVSASLIDYTSTFTDNGVITTEIRTNTTTGAVNTWEWLDLTVTNGISFNDIAADIANGGDLDNNWEGIPTIMYGSAGARADISSLNYEKTTGWNTVTRDSVNNLLTAFSGSESVPPDFSHIFTETQIDTFIEMYGDTFNEGLEDGAPHLPPNTFDTPEVSWGSFGTTSTLKYRQYNYGAEIYDGQDNNRGVDYSDWASIPGTVGRNGVGYFRGTWLNREVKVPEPSTILIFSLGLVGLTMRRRLN